MLTSRGALLYQYSQAFSDLRAESYVVAVLLDTQFYIDFYSAFAPHYWPPRRRGKVADYIIPGISVRLAVQSWG